MTRVCLDLFSGLGGYSQAFEDADEWVVVTVDIREDFGPDLCADVLDLRPSDFDRDFDVILASPPCTEFSPVRNLNGGHEPDGDHVTLAFHTIGLIRALRPRYWFLENPRGRLRSYIGKPEATVTYCQYGEEHMKPTDLWGRHPPGLSYRSCSYGDDCHVNHRDGRNAMYHAGKTDASRRSKVPHELSAAIREAVDEAISNPPPEQSTLGAATPGGEQA